MARPAVGGTAARGGRRARAIARGRDDADRTPALPAASDRRGSPFPPIGAAVVCLLEEADQLVAARGLPAGGTVFVHGDVWPGNVIWTEDEAAVLIDWKTAGVGAPGVDLGGLRNQVAIRFGPEAPDLVREGWERAAGTRAEEVAHWDAVAALNTRTELDALDGVGATDRVARSCARHSQTSGDELTIP